MNTSEKKSTHRTEVVSVKLGKHPNADSLSIVRLWGYQVVVRSADWVGVEIGAYIVPDSVVPDRPEYAFLRPCSACKGNTQVVCADCNSSGVLPLREQDRRIRVRKFRREMSQGMLVKAPEGSKIGDDVSDILGITRYEPLERGSGTSLGKAPSYGGPSCYVPIYDVESWYRYGSEVFTDGEVVYITEKLHGTNWRAVYCKADREFFVGSHRRWINRWQILRPINRWHAFLQWLHLEKPDKRQTNNVWWRVIDKYPEVESWCIANPDMVLYGEVYGDVQDLKYGHKDGDVSLALFCIYSSRTGLSVFPSFRWLPKVPIIAAGAYSDAFIRENIDGKSLIQGADHAREGIVIHSSDGRKLKAVSDAYLERAK